MGLLDNLKEIGNGVKDIFSAPVGLVYDTAKAITSEEYNPGFFGVFGGATEQLITGISQVGEGTGIADLGRSVGQSSLGPVLRSFFDEAELFYSTEFQQQTGQAPLGLRQLGVQPGQVSAQRVLATGTGAAGSLVGALHGGDPAEAVDLYRQWQKAATRSPGQAWVEQALVPDFFQRTPQEQDEIRATSWYNLASGTIDATSRWMTDPWVVAGKGAKFARQRYLTLRPDNVNQRTVRRHPKQYKDLQKLGYEVAEEFTDESGVRMLQLKSGKSKKVYHVTRASALKHMIEEGTIDRIPPGADEVFDADFQRVAFNEEIDAITGGRYDFDPARTQTEAFDAGADVVNRVRSIVDGPEVEAMADSIARYFDQDPEYALLLYHVTRAMSPDEVVDDLLAFAYTGRRHPDIDPQVYDNFAFSVDNAMEALSSGDPEVVKWLNNVMVNGGASDNFRNQTLFAARNAQEGIALDRINSEFAGRGLLGSRIQNFGRTPRFPGTTMRPLYLLAEGELQEAYRYSAALYQADPSDMPVIVELNAQGLPVVFEDFDLPTVPDPRSGNPSDAALFTLADKISTDQITSVLRPEPNELDTALNLAKTNFDYLEPSGRIHPRMFNPDGSPIEPDQIIPFEEIRDDFITASYLYGEEGPLASEKYLLARQRQRNQKLASDQLDLVGNISNHRIFQNNINWMDGKSADEIRRVMFPHNVYGGPLSVWLSRAKSYSERRGIMLAAMGFRSPELDSVEPILRAKLEHLMRESQRVASGGAPDPKLGAMLGMESRFRNVEPERMSQVLEEVIEEVQDQRALTRFLDSVSDAAPIRELKIPHGRRATNLVRKTSWYQESPLARPIRSVTEWRPHQFINVRDGMSDIQLVRQLEEAAPLGISAQETAKLREEYMAATNEQAKIHIIEKAERRIIEAAAEEAGLKPEEIEDLVRHATQGRARVGQFLESRRYAAGGQDRIDWYDEDTGEVMSLTLPLLSTQTQAWVPLANVKEIIRASSNIRRIRNRLGQVPREFIEAFYQVWKPTVLLRGGWMLRVVSDEQLRVLARGGSLLRHLAAIEAGEDIQFSGILKPGLTPGQRTGEGYALITGTRPIAALAQRAAGGVSKAAEKLGLLDPEYLRFIREAGIEDLVSARASFGGPSEQSLHSLQALMGRDEFTILDHLYDQGTGQWQSITQDSRMFGAAWQRVLVDQFGRDPLGRHIVGEVLSRGRFGLEAMDAQDIVEIKASVKKFLFNTAEGKEIAERMPWRSRKPDKWTDDLLEVLSDYTAGYDEGLLRGIMDQKVTREMLEGIDEALRPDVVHAEIIEQTLGTSGVSRYIKDFVSTAFDLSGRLPTDTLSRQPFFKQMYALEMQRLRRLKAQQGLDIDESAIQRMNKAARAFAIKETKEYLYDLAEVSRFGHMVRFLMPFYPAWQEVLKVWGKLAIQDPSVIGRGKLLWEAPNKAGLVYTDDEGEEYIQIRLSEKTSDKLGLTGWKKYVAEGGVRVGKSSFNLVLNSPLPGAGPVIQYPVNKVVKKKPELEESLRWLLPFGVTTDSSQIFLSPLVRQMRAEIKGPDSDKSYRRAFVDALTWMDVEYRAGRRTQPPTEAEAHDVARKLFTMRLVTRLMAPAQPIFDSPLQPYIDIYRDMQDNLGPENANEAFLNEYGMEFFAVTLSRTVSHTGIPPTVEGEVARREFADLIEQYPEYGRLIIGDQALGEFSTAAYAAQLERPLDPDNPFSEMERVYRPTELDPRTGTIMEVDRRLGWQEYIQAMDVIDLQRKQRGLPNLRVSGAEDLAQAKRAVTQFIAQKYPSWWEDFNTRDDLKWDSRMEAMRAIASNPSTSERPDIQGLEQYIALREAILQELNRRKQLGGSATLDAVANQDLAGLWETLVLQLLDDNIAFGPLYYRYLEGDPVRLR